MVVTLALRDLRHRVLNKGNVMRNCQWHQAKGGGEWSALPSGRFASGKGAQVPFEKEAGWIPEYVWTLPGIETRVLSLMACLFLLFNVRFNIIDLPVLFWFA